MTFNDGCLGSRNDEERSEMRYVMRIADLVNHQIFERTLHFRLRMGVFLFECLFPKLIHFINYFKRKNCVWAFCCLKFI